MTTQKKSSGKTKKTQSKITKFFKREYDVSSDIEYDVSSDIESDFPDNKTSENSNPCCFCGIEMGPNRLSQYCSRQCLYGN